MLNQIKAGILWILGIGFYFFLFSIEVNVLRLTNDPTYNINLIKQVAQQTFPNNKALADLTAAQAILESRLQANPSELASKYNNLFGIKWPVGPDHIVAVKHYGQPVNMLTHEVIHGKEGVVSAKFIHFNSIEDCLAYRKYMLTWSIYKNVLASSTLEEAANTIKKDHYATDPSYVEQIVGVYNKWLK